MRPGNGYASGGLRFDQMAAGGHPLGAPFSLLYGVLLRLREKAYHGGILRRQRLPGLVLSVGNLTAGGTGKTPAAAMLAGWARAQGYRVAILSRGYGGRYPSRVFVASDGERVLGGPRETGDEPQLLANRVPGVPVVLSPRRHLAGCFARARFGTELFILDDGFQHLALERDENLLLLDSLNPFGNARVLPWGPLREPLPALARATAFILTRWEKGAGAAATEDFLRRRFPGRLILRAVHRPEKLIFPRRSRHAEAEEVRGRRVVAFAGIARPEGFRHMLENLGAEVADFYPFRDHHSYTRHELAFLFQRRRTLGASWILTTEKDWMRIASLPMDTSRIGYLTVAFELLSGQDALLSRIQARMREHG